MKTIEIYRNEFRNFSKFSKLIEIYRNFDHFSKFQKISKFWPNFDFWSKLIKILINFEKFRNWFWNLASKRNLSKFRFEKWDWNEIGHFDQFRNILPATQPIILHEVKRASEASEASRSEMVEISRSLQLCMSFPPTYRQKKFFLPP